MEIVSKPDLRSAEEAGLFVRKVRTILRYLGTCDGNMEQGSLRCDVNISVRHPGDALGTRAEIKNINSVRFVHQAIEYETRRQIKEIEGGGDVALETRRFDPRDGVTHPMRRAVGVRARWGAARCSAAALRSAWRRVQKPSAVAASATPRWSTAATRRSAAGAGESKGNLTRYSVGAAAAARAAILGHLPIPSPTFSASSQLVLRAPSSRRASPSMQLAFRGTEWSCSIAAMCFLAGAMCLPRIRWASPLGGPGQVSHSGRRLVLSETGQSRDQRAEYAPPSANSGAPADEASGPH